MRRAVFCAAFAALLALSCSGARLSASLNEVERLVSSSADGSLRSSAQALLEILRRGRGKGKEEEEEGNAIFSVKFYVPPSESKDFEDRWMDFSEDVDKEDQPEIFTLKKAKLTNMMYFSYGEFENMEDLKDHFTSDHFDDFSDWVNEHDIKWDMELLKTSSKDIDEQQRKKHMKSHKKMRDTEEAHILMMYTVPPGEGENFVDAWTDCAEDTLGEEENSVYSLRKVATDNTRYWGYGSWDSHESFRSHFESKHVGRFLDYTEDKDIKWVIIPLVEVGGSKM